MYTQDFSLKSIDSFASLSAMSFEDQQKILELCSTLKAHYQPEANSDSGSDDLQILLKNYAHTRRSLIAPSEVVACMQKGTLRNVTKKGNLLVQEEYHEAGNCLQMMIEKVSAGWPLSYLLIFLKAMHANPEFFQSLLDQIDEVEYAQSFIAAFCLKERFSLSLGLEFCQALDILERLFAVKNRMPLPSQQGVGESKKMETASAGLSVLSYYQGFIMLWFQSLLAEKSNAGILQYGVTKEVIELAGQQGYLSEGSAKKLVTLNEIIFQGKQGEKNLDELAAILSICNDKGQYLSLAEWIYLLPKAQKFTDFLNNIRELNLPLGKWFWPDRVFEQNSASFPQESAAQDGSERALSVPLQHLCMQLISGCQFERTKLLALFQDKQALTNSTEQLSGLRAILIELNKYYPGVHVSFEVHFNTACMYEINALKKQMDEKESKHHSVEGLNKKLLLRIRDLKKELAEKREEMDRFKSSQQDELTTLHRVNEELSQTVAKTLQEQEDAQKQVKALQAEKITLQQVRQKEISRLRQTEHAKASELEETCSRLRDELEEMKVQHQQQQQKQALFGSENTRLQTQNHRLKEQRSDLKKANKQLKQALSVFEAEKRSAMVEVSASSDHKPTSSSFDASYKHLVLERGATDSIAPLSLEGNVKHTVPPAPLWQDMLLALQENQQRLMTYWEQKTSYLWQQMLMALQQNQQAMMSYYDHRICGQVYPALMAQQLNAPSYMRAPYSVRAHSDLPSHGQTHQRNAIPTLVPQTVNPQVNNNSSGNGELAAAPHAVTPNRNGSQVQAVSVQGGSEVQTSSTPSMQETSVNWFEWEQLERKTGPLFSTRWEL